MVLRNINECWTPADTVCKSVSSGKNISAAEFSKQFSIILLKGMIIYKSQGNTYKNINC